MEETTTRVTQTSEGPTAASTSTPPSQGYGTKKAIFRTYQVIWYMLGLVEVLLAFRFVLKMLGANPGSGFVSMIYAITAPLAVPFRGIFPTPVVEGSVFEWSTIIAAIVYAIVAWGLVKLFQLVKPTNPHEVSKNVDNQ